MDTYDYRLLDIDNEDTKRYINNFNRFIDSIILKIDDFEFSTWKYRYFIAAKYILATTALVNSFDYAKQNNVGMSLPYLAYYSVLSAGRVLLCVNPKNDWNNGALIKSGHAKIIKLVCDEISRINKTVGEEYLNSIKEYRDFREIFSYNFAFNGFGTFPAEELLDTDRLNRIVTFILEIAELQSSLFSIKYQKIYPSYHNLVMKPFEEAAIYNLNSTKYADNNDYYFVKKGFRKKSSLYPISYSISAGMVEDFFEGISLFEELNKCQFDPDADWNIVFDTEY